MIRKVKVKKQNRFLETFSRTILALAIVSFLISSIFLRTYNVHLSVQIQDMQNRVIQLGRDNEVLSRQIQDLSSKDRVVSIAADNGLSNVQENIVLIQSGE